MLDFIFVIYFDSTGCAVSSRGMFLTTGRTRSEKHSAGKRPSGGSMSTEEHKGLLYTFFAELNHGQLNVIDQLFSPTFCDRSPGPASPTQIVGREGIKRYFSEYFT